LQNERTVFEALAQNFPTFAGQVALHEPEDVRPGWSRDAVEELQSRLGVPLPTSYRTFLESCRQLTLLGGVVQFSEHHPFFHNFPPLSALSSPQLQSVRARGADWPPPSQGMLCFAEFFLEADGDQVLFDVSGGLQNGEYPVVYYAHDAPSIRVLATSFGEFLEGCLDHFNLDEE